MFQKCVILAGINLLKVDNRNIRTRCEICSKLTIKTWDNDALGQHIFWNKFASIIPSKKTWMDLTFKYIWKNMYTFLFRFNIFLDCFRSFTNENLSRDSLTELFAIKQPQESFLWQFPHHHSYFYVPGILNRTSVTSALFGNFIKNSVNLFSQPWNVRSKKSHR